MGIIVFFTGMMAFVDVIFMILRIIFVYLLSVLVVAFMIIISPLVIPMALFNLQERYFKRWLDITITAILTPMMLFAFVGLFMGIYDLQIDRLIDILGGADANGKTQFDAYWRMNQPKFSWLMPADANLAQDFEDLSKSEEVGSPAVQSFINPYARRALDSNIGVTPGVNFGEAGQKVLQQLVLGFVGLWIVSSLIKSMISIIPEITQGIVGTSLGLSYQAASFEGGVQKAISGMRDSAKNNLMGGGGGGNVPGIGTRR
jgi:type IV secretory pathway VirB6-like protein